MIELIVVVSIIAVLIGLLLPALASMRTTARQTLEMNAGRQLMLAFTAYAADHDDGVLPGYHSDLPAVDVRGEKIGPPISARYPWRIAPYLSFNFRGMYVNEHEEVLERIENSGFDSFVYIVSLYPSLGMNTAWIGGDEQEAGFSRNMNFIDQVGAFYVRTMAEPLHPERLMVFGSARGGDPNQTGGITVMPEGYFKITSPYWLPGQGTRWAETFDPGDPPEEYGHVSPRFNGKAVAAIFDGHVEMFNDEKLRDMRHWANRARDAEYYLGDQ